MHCINLYTPRFAQLVKELQEMVACPVVTSMPMEDPVSLVPCMHKFELSTLKAIFMPSQNPPCPLCRRGINHFFRDAILKDLGNSATQLKLCLEKKESFAELHKIFLKALSFVECPYHELYPKTRYMKTTSVVFVENRYLRFHTQALINQGSTIKGYNDFLINEVTEKLLEMYAFITRNVVTLLNQTPSPPLYYKNIVTYLKPKEIAAFASVCTLWNRMQDSDAFWQVCKDKILDEVPSSIKTAKSSFCLMSAWNQELSGDFPYWTDNVCREFNFKRTQMDSLFTTLHFQTYASGVIVGTFVYAPKEWENVKKYLRDAGLYVWEKEGITVGKDALVVNFDRTPLIVFRKLFQSNLIPARYLTSFYQEILNRKRYLLLRKPLV